MPEQYFCFMFGPVHRPGQEYQVRVIENVTTDTKDREGGVFYYNIMMLSMQCQIWKAPLISESTVTI